MVTKPYKVMIVEDSAYSRELLRSIIESDPELKVIAMAENGEHALNLLENIQPDVITMDVNMPGIDGFETTRRIMVKKPIPVVIISAGCSPQNVHDSFRAMDAGALAILVKPIRSNEIYFHQKALEIINTIKVTAEVKLITRRPKATSPKEIEEESLKLKGIGIFEAVAIGASLGGPPAIEAILSNLPKNFPVPVFIVQHIVPGFSKGLVDWLNRTSRLPVSLGQDKEHALPGHAYLAPDLAHMEVKPGNIISLVTEKTTGLQPSVSRLFFSMANTHGPNCVGVLLTGMGRDGAAEMLLMRHRGAVTIAQDEGSCIVYGMPKEAVELGAVSKVLPLPQIAPTLVQLIDRL